MRGRIFLLCIVLLGGCSKKPAPEPQQLEKAPVAPQARQADVEPQPPNAPLPPARGFQDVRRPTPRPSPHVPMMMPKDVFRAIAVQADGKILAGGSAYNGTNDDGLLMRFLPDGKVDPSFAGGSGIREAFGDEEDQFFAIGIQKDGRVLAAGSSSLGRRNFFILARYRPDGKLDGTFATNGKAVTEIQTMRDAARCMAILDDGRILVAGSTSNDPDGGDNDFAVARYTAEGLPDPTFGRDGNATVDFDEGDDIANCMAIQRDGKVIVAGNSAKSGRSALALVRFNSDGKRDTSFGRRGKVITTLGGRNGIVTGIALQSDGKIIVAGSVYGEGRRDVILVRDNPDGSSDGEFGDEGRVITEVGDSVDANCLVLQADGRMIVAGAATSGQRYGFCVLRYSPSGKFDGRLETFGNVTGASEAAESFGHAVALERDGAILVAGASTDEKGKKASVVRYKGN